MHEPTAAALAASPAPAATPTHLPTHIPLATPPADTDADAPCVRLLRARWYRWTEPHVLDIDLRRLVDGPWFEVLRQDLAHDPRLDLGTTAAAAVVLELAASLDPAHVARDRLGWLRRLPTLIDLVRSGLTLARVHPAEAERHIQALQARYRALVAETRPARCTGAARAARPRDSSGVNQHG